MQSFDLISHVLKTMTHANVAPCLKGIYTHMLQSAKAQWKSAHDKSERLPKLKGFEASFKGLVVLVHGGEVHSKAGG